jgi:eight-cysteine-cluster-containing protein
MKVLFLIAATVALAFGGPKASLCEPSGCSGELCTEKGKKRISPCVVLPQHQCVKKSKCEVQADGKCGWTPTEEYQACLKQFLPK